MLTDILPAEIFAVALVFCRIGAAVMLMPGIGENFISPQARLLFALALAVLITPVVRAGLPALPATMGPFVGLVVGEVIIGLFFGTIARIMILTLETAGFIIAFQSGLASAQVFNPGIAQQGSLPGALLSFLGLVLLFQTNLHHLFLAAAMDSYTLFQPGRPLPVQDMSDFIARLVTTSFRVAVQIAAPFLVIFTLFNVGLGILARLMPQLQIFFLALPAQLMLGLLLFAVTLHAGLTWFMQYYEGTLQAILQQ